jgi:hypothetical protein
MYLTGAPGFPLRFIRATKLNKAVSSLKLAA